MHSQETFVNNCLERNMEEFGPQHLSNIMNGGHACTRSRTSRMPSRVDA
jgi:hypothetical protein